MLRAALLLLSFPCLLRAQTLVLPQTIPALPPMPAAAVLRPGDFAPVVSLAPLCAGSVLPSLRPTPSALPRVAGPVAARIEPLPRLQAVQVAGTPEYRPEKLREILEEVDAAVARGERPVLLFDLDDTLVSVASRHLRILREFIARPEVRFLYPEFVLRAERAGLADMRYQFPDTVRALGLDSRTGVAAADLFWEARFFADDYIREDRPFAGAVDYVRELSRRGGRIVYLTARAELRRAATLSNLEANGFPLPDGERVVLMLKQDRDQDTGEYKREALQKVAQMGRVVAAYENEPKNANIFKEGFPDAVVFMLDTRRPSGGPPPRPDLVWVRDFVLP